MRFLSPTAPVRRIFSGLLALVLAFTNLNFAHAAIDPVYGILNGSFGENSQCSSDEWTTSGVVKIRSNPQNGNCFAVLTAGIYDGGPSVSLATIEQTFIVDPNKAQLAFYLQPFSNIPGTGYRAQTVSLYDEAGNIIYQKANNLNLPPDEISMTDYYVAIDLANHKEQSLRLKVEVKVERMQRISPTSVQLRMDFDRLGNVNGPETTPGPGW